MGDEKATLKQYRVRNGYVWVGLDGKPTGQRIVTNEDPGFAGQQHKLEEFRSEATGKKEKEGEVRSFGSELNRMIPKAQMNR